MLRWTNPRPAPAPREGVWHLFHPLKPCAGFMENLSCILAKFKLTWFHYDSIMVLSSKTKLWFSNTSSIFGDCGFFQEETWPQHPLYYGLLVLGHSSHWGSGPDWHQIGSYWPIGGQGRVHLECTVKSLRINEIQGNIVEVWWVGSEVQRREGQQT